MTGFDLAVWNSIKNIFFKYRYFILTIAIIIIGCKFQVEIIRHRAADTIERERSEILYIKDGYDTSVIISLPDTRRKVAAFSALILKRYSYRRHDKKLKAMDKMTMDLFIQNNIKYAELLNYNYYDLLGIALMESEFNPYAEGELQDERSMFQFSPSAVDSAAGYYKQLPCELKKIFTFKYDDHFTDLEDPLNALKIAAVLFWGLRKDYGRQMDWVLTIYHWGKSYMHRFYKLGEFPEFFTFKSRKTGEVYQRSCKDYFNTWYNITENFRRGNIEIQKELNYWHDIRGKMSIYELQLVDSYKVIKKLRYALEEARKIQTDYEIAMRDYNKKIYKEVAQVDAKYKQIFKGLKTGEMGKFKTSAKYMKQSQGFFKKFRNEVYRHDQWQFWILLSLFAGCFLVTTAGMTVYIIRWRNKKN